MKTLNQDFQEFIYRRCESFGDLLEGNSQYQRLREKNRELYAKIAAISPEYKQLIEEFEDNGVEICCLIEEEAYKSGMKDGIQLKEELLTARFPESKGA